MDIDEDNKYECEARDAGMHVASSLCAGANRHHTTPLMAGIVNGLMGEHRTLQQSGIATFVAGLIRYAEEAKAGGFCDPRNAHVIDKILEHKSALAEIAGAPFI